MFILYTRHGRSNNAPLGVVSGGQYECIIN